MTDHLDDLVRPGGDVARALLADTKWLTRAFPDDPLELIDVAAMTPTHQRNLLTWLRANATQVHWFARKAIRDQYDRGEISAWDRGTALNLIGQMPDLWLERTVLVRRLVELVHGQQPRRERRRFLPARLRRTR